MEAGFDGILHGHFQTPDGRNDFDERLARRLLDHGAYVNPTLQTNRNRGDAQVIGQLPAGAQEEALATWRARYARVAANFGRLYQSGRAAGLWLGLGLGIHGIR